MLGSMHGTTHTCDCAAGELSEALVDGLGDCDHQEKIKIR